MTSIATSESQVRPAITSIVISRTPPQSNDYTLSCTIRNSLNIYVERNTTKIPILDIELCDDRSYPTTNLIRETQVQWQKINVNLAPSQSDYAVFLWYAQSKLQLQSFNVQINQYVDDIKIRTDLDSENYKNYKICMVPLNAEQQLPQLLIYSLYDASKLNTQFPENVDYKGIQVGDQVDCLDDQNVWLIAHIDNIRPENETVYVVYWGWAKAKWSIWCKMDSKNLQAFRSQTCGIPFNTSGTGRQQMNPVQPKDYHQELTSYLPKLRNTVIKLKTNFNVRALSDSEFRFINQQQNMKILSFITNVNLTSIEQLVDVVEFCQHNILLVTLALSSYLKELKSETRDNFRAFNINAWIDALWRLLGGAGTNLFTYFCKPRDELSDPRNHHSQYNLMSEKTVCNRTSWTERTRYYNDRHPDRLPEPSIIALSFINLFARLNGFELLKNYFMTAPLPPIKHFAMIVNALNNLKFCFTSEFDIPLFDIFRYYIRNISDDHLKSPVSRQYLDNLVEDLREVISAAENFDTIVLAYRCLLRQLKFEVSLRKINTSILTVRMEGATDLTKLLQWVHEQADTNVHQTNQLPESLSKYVLTIPKTSEWLKENKVLQCIFNTDCHEQLVRKSGILISFLVIHKSLTDLDIERIWNTANQQINENFIKICYDLMSEQCKSMNEQMIDSTWNQWFNEQRSENLHLLKDYDLSFINAFTLNAIVHRHNDGSIPTKWYGLDVLWKIITSDDDKMPSSNVNQAMTHFTQILSYPQFKTQLSVYIEKIVSIISQSSNPSTNHLVREFQLSENLLTLLQHIINVQPEKLNRDRNQLTRSDWCQKLDNDSKFIDLLVENICVYERFYCSYLLSQSDEIDSDQSISETQYISHLTAQFSALTYFSSTATIHLTQQHIDSLWKVFVTNNANVSTTHQPVQFYTWLASCVYEKSAFDKKTFTCFKEKVNRYIFTDLICQNSQILAACDAGLLLFRSFFNYSNHSIDSISSFRDSDDLQVLNFNKLLGLDALWQLYLSSYNNNLHSFHSTDSSFNISETLNNSTSVKQSVVGTIVNSVSSSSARMLTSLHLMNTTAKSSEKRAIVKSFIDTCMIYISNALIGDIHYSISRKKLSKKKKRFNQTVEFITNTQLN